MYIDSRGKTAFKFVRLHISTGHCTRTSIVQTEKGNMNLAVKISAGFMCKTTKIVQSIQPPSKTSAFALQPEPESEYLVDPLPPSKNSARPSLSITR
jgi:hypothetical protein